MTHEEIEVAIERLKICCSDSHHVMIAFMDGNSGVYHDCGKFKATLIDLLEQADPDTHMELPVDADGVPIHVGNELCGHYYPDGGVYCVSINGSEAIFVSKIGEHYRDAMLWKPSECRHYHMPTVEDVLREFVNEWVEADSEGDIFAEYAKKLREVMQA